VVAQNTWWEGTSPSLTTLNLTTICRIEDRANPPPSRGRVYTFLHSSGRLTRRAGVCQVRGPGRHGGFMWRRWRSEIDQRSQAGFWSRLARMGTFFLKGTTITLHTTRNSSGFIEVSYKINKIAQINYLITVNVSI